MKLFDNRISLEDEGTVQNKEIEVTFYCKLGNKEGLTKASSIEKHYQYHSAFENGQTCRVRKTVKGEETNIEFTIKVKTGNNEGLEEVNEVTTKIDDDFMQVFKTVSHQHLEKNRYNFLTENIELSFKEGDETRTFKVPDVKYELDVFSKKDGSESEWAKIDLEVDAIMDYIAQNHPGIKDVKMNIKLSHLPFEPTDIIIMESATEEQKAFVKQLWDTEYNLK